MRARCPRPSVCMLSVALGVSSWAVAATPAKFERRCHAEVGRATTRCLKDYVAEVSRCRDAADAACEAALRIPDGTLATILADLGAPIGRVCTDASAERISLSLGVERHVHYVAEACQKWADYFADTAYADDLGALSPEDLACQRDVALRLARLRDKVVAASAACDAALFASVVGYGTFLRAVHPSFADQCEVPEVLRGVSAACEPDVLPWRHVRHIENYLALNFFDATLAGNAEALARLDPAALADVEDLAYQRK